jgi:hypothetical protein
MNYKSISTGGAVDNMGGTSIRILYAPISYFAVNGIKKLPASPSNPDAAVTISASHQFKPGKGFHTIRCILDTNKISLKPVGERGGRGLKEEFEGKVSGNSKLMAFLMAMFKNDEFVVLIPTHDGLYIQVGSEDLPCELLPEHETGTIESGVNSMMVKGTSFTLRRTFYSGAITMFPEGAGTVVVNFTALGADAETFELRLADGTTIATLTQAVGDTLEDIAYKFYQSVSNADVLSPTAAALGFTATLTGTTVIVRTPFEGEVNYIGTAVSVTSNATIVAAVSPTFTEL